MTETEFLKEFKGVEVQFVRYWKYQFTYGTTLPNGDTVTVVFGAKCIYREEFSLTQTIQEYRLNNWEVTRANPETSK
jgi:hypothetical protein